MKSAEYHGHSKTFRCPGLTACVAAGGFQLWDIPGHSGTGGHPIVECKDVASCYKCSVVTLCVLDCVHVCVLDTIMSCAKTAEPIKMPFWLWTLIGPKNHLLLGCWACWSKSPRGKGQFLRDMSHPIMKYTESLCEM